MSRLLTRAEAARYLGRTVAWLDQCHLDAVGPTRVVKGGRSGYTLAELIRWKRSIGIADE